MNDSIHPAFATGRALPAGAAGLMGASLLRRRRAVAATTGAPIFAFAGCYNTVDGPGPLTPPRETSGLPALEQHRVKSTRCRRR